MIVVLCCCYCCCCNEIPSGCALSNGAPLPTHACSPPLCSGLHMTFDAPSSARLVASSPGFCPRAPKDSSPSTAVHVQARCWPSSPGVVHSSSLLSLHVKSDPGPRTIIHRESRNEVGLGPCVSNSRPFQLHPASLILLFTPDFSSAQDAAEATGPE